MVFDCVICYHPRMLKYRLGWNLISYQDPVVSARDKKINIIVL
jgi:hypothetical protein